MLKRLLPLLAVLLWAEAAAAADQANLRYLRISTGYAAGSSFRVGMAIATAISSPPGSRACDNGGSCGVPGLVAVAQTSEGSVANIAAVAGGQVDTGIAQSDLVWSAVNGQGIYFQRARFANLRVIANLYQESLHLVVRRGAGIEKVGDLAGKRVSLDRPGSGIRFNAEQILNAFGVRLTQIRIVEADPGDAYNLFAAGELDALFVIGAAPVQAVSDLVASGNATLVSLSGTGAANAIRRHRFYSRDVLPPNTYGAGIGEVETLSVGAQWVISEAADEGLVYAITKALWQPRNRPMLDAGNERGRLIRPNTALYGVSTPLHPGALRYYRESGVLPPDMELPPSQ